MAPSRRKRFTGSTWGRASKPALALILTVTSALFAAGCVATVEERPPRYVYVAGPPPPPLVEARGDASSAGMIWVEGYWHWNGVQYVWIPGHWETPPVGYVWIPPRYANLSGRHVYHAGRWVIREQGHVPAAPTPVPR